MLFPRLHSTTFFLPGVTTMDYQTDLDTGAEPMIAIDYPLHPVTDLVDYLREYSRQKPEVVAFACFGIGFILGWKLKPW
jgi:hypothetical protein